MLDIVVVGAGLSGLSAALQLQSKGYKVQVFEANGKVGGRCKSDYIDGYILDKGLHFFQKGYSESKNTFDYRSLRMENIYPGVMMHHKNNFHLITNPIRKLTDSISLAFVPFMTFKDKLKLGTLLTFLMSKNEDDLLKFRNMSTKDFLMSKGFSNQLIQHFFQPLCQAIFFDSSLETSAYIFTSTLKNFCFDDSALPAYGIGSIAVQIADKLEEDTVHFHSKVKDIFPNGIELANGEIIHAKRVIVSIPPYELEKIIPGYKSEMKFTKCSSLYFSTKTPPVKSPILMMNSESKGIVNHVFVPTSIQPSYAPPGYHLVNVSLKSINSKEGDELIDEVLSELIDWFGVKVNDWMHIKTYHLPISISDYKTQSNFKYYEEKDGVYFCGDYLSYGNVNNAILSGKSVAKVVDTEIQKKSKIERNKVVFH